MPLTSASKMPADRATSRTRPATRALCLSALCAAAVAPATAQTAPVIGQPLDFVVQLRVDPADPSAADCLQAEVTSGERRLPPDRVRASRQQLSADSVSVRVQTTVAIDEPVIGVLVETGCQARNARRYVLLADPPAPNAPSVLPAVEMLAAAAAATPVAADPGPAETAPAAPARTMARPARMPDRAASAPARPSAARPARAVAAAAPAAPPARSGAPRLRLDVSEPAAPGRVAGDAAAARPAPAPVTPPAPPPAVQLAALGTGGDVVEQAIQAVAIAASATRAASAQASAAEQRIASLERTVEQLRSESRASRELALQMSERLSRGTGGSPWLVPLAVAAGLLALLCAWLAWQWQALRRAQQTAWAAGADRPGSRFGDPQRRSRLGGEDLAPAPTREVTAPVPFVNEEPPVPTMAPPATAAARARPAAAPAWPPPAPVEPEIRQAMAAAPRALPDPVDEPAEPAMQRTLPAGAVSLTAMPVRDVSIEELIDLEQQAEFFIVLGQDEAAIDLLVDHIRLGAGGSPLPYLKLLEIYHRRGERAAYERTRDRFNQRFNAVAPEWEQGLQHGRSLDDYPGVLPRVQQVWPRPLDAMAELEALLFRKSRGDLFDLPAYREVLFLYSLARDLLDRESAETGSVDLLLPLADGGEFSATTPHPYFGSEHESVFDSRPVDDLATAPVDLDLSAGDRKISIFDTLPGAGRGPQRS